MTVAAQSRTASHVAPTELGWILRDAFYKHSAPLALRDYGIRQQYRVGARDRTASPKTKV
jgi:hypothetical protein